MSPHSRILVPSALILIALSSAGWALPWLDVTYTHAGTPTGPVTLNDGETLAIGPYEQDGLAGTDVTLLLTPGDAVDPAPTLGVDPAGYAAGGTFPLGTTAITCTVTANDGADVSTIAINVTIVDTTAPTITQVQWETDPSQGTPVDTGTINVVALNDPNPDVLIVGEGTPGGFRKLNFVGSDAADACDVAPGLTFDPPSGTNFPVGDTPVDVTVADDSAHTVMRTFTVRVVTDAVAPSIRVSYSYPLPGGGTQTGTVEGSDVTLAGVEQVQRAGTQVDWTITGVDGVDPSPTVTYQGSVPPGYDSGSNFPLGTTVVSYVVTDARSNTSLCTFTITVVDTTSPDPPAPVQWSSGADSGSVSDGGTIQTEESPPGSGSRAVDFSVVPEDVCDTAVSVTFDPPSGTLFAVGTTAVTVTATDDSGNASTAAFSVEIQQAGELARPTMLAEPIYTEGTTNTVRWTGLDPTAEFYDAECATDSGFISLVATDQVLPGGDPQPHTFSGLSDGGLYYYRVRAGRGGGGVGNPVLRSWTQTTQADFDQDLLTNTITRPAPDDDVILSLGGAGPPQQGTVPGPNNRVSRPAGSRGNQFLCTTSMVLTRIEQFLDMTVPSTMLTFTVYEASAANGPYTVKDQTSAATADLGDTWYQSPALSVALVAGKFYRITTTWDNPTFFRYNAAPVHPVAMPFGESQQGLSGSGPAPADGVFTASTNGYYQRLTVQALGGGYQPSGTVVSVSIGASELITSWDRITFGTTTPPNTGVTVEVDDGTGWRTVLSGDSLSGLSGSSLRARATLESLDGVSTPALTDWSVTYYSSGTLDVIGSTASRTAPGSYNSGSGRSRGNEFRCDTSTNLVKIEAGLEIPVGNIETLIFSVYESDAQNGTYTTILQTTQTVTGNGPGLYTSGPMALPLVAGMYYRIATSWNHALGFFWRGNGSPQAVSFGTQTRGLNSNSGYPPPSGNAFAASTNAYWQRLTTQVATGPGHSNWSNYVSSTQDASPPVIFASDVTVEQQTLAGSVTGASYWTQTTQVDWESNGPANLVNVDTKSSPGDVMLSQVSATVNVGTIGGAGGSWPDPTPLYMRGNFFRCDRSTRVTKIEQWLGFPDTNDHDLNFAIYRGTALNGTYNRIWQSGPVSVTGVSGATWYGSGDITPGVQLTAGSFYVIAVQWTDPAYYWSQTVAQQTVDPWGVALDGYHAEGVSAPPGTTTYVAHAFTNLLYYQRVTTNDATYMDQGRVTSVPINGMFQDPPNNSWGVLNYTADEPSGTNLAVDVLDSGGTPIAGYTDVASGIDLSGLDPTTYPALILRATFTPDVALAATPTLSDWTVDIDNGVPFGAMAIDSVDPDFPVLFNDGTNKLTGEYRMHGGGSWTPLLPDTYLQLGQWDLRWTSEDHFGPNFGNQNPSSHTATVTQLITVVDTKPPDAALVQWACSWNPVPATGQASPLPLSGVVGPGMNVVVEQETRSGTAVMFIGAGTDACDAHPTFTFAPGSGTVFPLGTSTVAYTASDASGNVIAGSFQVTVVDTLPPVIPPGYITPTITVFQPEHEYWFPAGWSWPQVEAALVYWGKQLTPPLGLIDICDADVTTNPIATNNAANLVYHLGPNMILWTVSDSSGNTVVVPQILQIDRLRPGGGGEPH